MGKREGDVEAGNPLLQSNPELQHRLAFIRKVYSILTIQLLATIGFAALVAAFQSVTSFFKDTPAGLALYIVVLVLGLVVMCPLYIHKNRHPLNFFLLGIFTLCMGFTIGVITAFTNGKVVIEAASATTVVVISLTVYTFWAARRGQDFGFLHPFLISCLGILFVFGICQIFFSMGKFSELLYTAICTLVFCAYIVYDTNNLIKTSYDNYIWASVSLYLDIINLFLQLLKLMKKD